MPLIEIVRAPATDDDTLATAFDVAKTLKKNAVLVKDAAGFVVNRLLLRLMAEIFATVDEGTPVEVADAALRPLGLPMSPYVLLQLVGPAVALHVEENLHAAFGDRFPVSANLQALVASGRPGIYDWTADGEPYVSDETAELLVVGDRPSTAGQVRERALNAVAIRDRPDVGRGGCGSADGHRSVHDSRRRLAVLPGRHYALSGPGGHLRAGDWSPFPATWNCQRRRRLGATSGRQRSDSASLT